MSNGVLTDSIKHRFIPDIPTLKEHIVRGVNTINDSDIWRYLTGKDLS